MGQDKVCSCEEKHQEHLCELKSKGMTRKIIQLTGNPNVACANCGEETNTEDNVCSPVSLFI
jgi:hypothetical protein